MLRRRDAARLERAETSRARPRARAADIHAVARAKAAMGATIREALARAGIDPAGVPRLHYVDEDMPALPPDLATDDCGAADAAEAFTAKMGDLASRFAGGSTPDFAGASFAELLAWSLAQPPG